MPNVQDYDPNDEEKPLLGGRGTASSSSGTALTQAAPQQESSFVPWSRFVSANKEVSDREAGQLKSQVQSDVDKAVNERNAASQQGSDEIRSNYAGYEKPAPKTGQPGTGAFVPSNSTGAFGRPNVTVPSAGETLSSWTPEPQAAPQRQQPGRAASMPGMGQQGGGFVPGNMGLPNLSSTGASYMATPKANSARPPGTMANANYYVGALNPDKLGHNPETGKVDGVGVAGSKTLEDMLGADRWKALVGDTNRATTEASALGSEGGVQALLGPSATGFDAALVGGSGNKDVRDISKQYGGGKLGDALVNADQSQQDAWHKLMGDVSNAAGARDKMIADNTAAQSGMAPTQDRGTEKTAWDEMAGYGEGSTAEDHALMNTLLFGNADENPWSNMHAMGMTLNPADWATIAMGEAGIDVPVTTEIFGQMGPWGAAAQSSGMAATWNEGRFIMAFNELVNRGVSAAARHAFLKFLQANPDVLKQYLSMQNPGFMARNMRQWMTSWDQAHPPQNAAEQASAGATAKLTGGSNNG